MDDDDATGGMDGEIFFASIPRASRVARGVGDEAERDGNARVSTSPKGVLKPYSRERGESKARTRGSCAWCATANR